jgi:2-methylcitrate dehydratase PrpD
VTVSAATRLDDVVATALELAADPEPAVGDAVLRVTSDIVAAAFAGARQPGHAALVARLSVPAAGAPPTVAADAPRRAGVLSSALLNATAAVALELDESLVGGGHPGAHVVPAALAAAQDQGASGAALLHAIHVGYEVTARLHRVRRPRFPSHPHGALGAVGAAAAVATLRGESALAAARAAGTLPLLPTWSACFEGATARDAWPGVAALVGIVAADLAASGLTGSAAAPFDALDRIADALDPPGDAPLILRSAQRVHPVAGPLQSAVEAAAGLRAAALRGPIAAVVVETVEANLKFDRLPAANDLSARFSLPYAVAAALSDDEPDFCFRPQLLPLARRVDVVVGPDLQDRAAHAIGARVIATGAGADHEQVCLVPRGHPDRPLSQADALARTGRLLGVRAGVADRLAVLRELPSVTGLLAVTP